MGDSDPLNADFTTLDALKQDLSELSVAFDNTQNPLADSHNRVVAGAGDFSGDLTSGAAGFLLAWEVAFRTMSDGTGLVGNNIGKQVVDLKAVDATFTTSIQL